MEHLSSNGFTPRTMESSILSTGLLPSLDIIFMTLTSDLGCFLLDNGPSRPLSVYHIFSLHLHSLVEFSRPNR